jgi:catechol 2,3-dioxygenase
MTSATAPLPGAPDPARVIDPRTVLDHVHLNVKDLDRVLPFYTDVLRFKLHRSAESPQGRTAHLGAGRHDLLRLSERPEAPRPEGTAGMYHMAFLVKERVDLARWLKRIADTGTPVEGLVHHAPAAEAIYLPDPEGNTVELNWDPPRELWSAPGRAPFTGNLPLDVESLFGLLEGQPEAWDGPPPDTTFSHIHLYVGDLAAARRFYVDVLGFEETVNMAGQAGFVSAGGYHHHVAYNIWKGRGIPPQPEGAAGLAYFVVRVPDGAELERVLARVRAAGLPTAERPQTANAGTGPGVFVRDPAGLGVVLAAAVPAA